MKFKLIMKYFKLINQNQKKIKYKELKINNKNNFKLFIIFYYFFINNNL